VVVLKVAGLVKVQGGVLGLKGEFVGGGGDDCSGGG
jgi:hypothetical protein